MPKNVKDLHYSTQKITNSKYKMLDYDLNCDRVNA